ncbi:MAG TPA: acyltransferase [Caulobacter sp.]|nr:acyltransferase [Caulobacter sp.]
MKSAPVRQPLTTIQAGRGVASLLVVLFHLTKTIFNTPQYWPQGILGNVFLFGHAGVNFFFVLSGFIIFHAHASDLGKPELLGRYAWRRATRIYPPYLLVLAVIVVAYAMIPSLNTAPPTPTELTASILLVGPNDRPPLAVAWTLFHEIAFYAVFAVAIINVRAGVIVGAIWALACAVSLFTPWKEAYPLNPLNLLFGFGIVARILVDRQIPGAVWLAGVGAALFIGLGLEEVYHPIFTGEVRHLLYGAASFLLIVGMARAEFSGRMSAPKWLTFLGDASFSIYLVHYPALSVFAKVFTKLPLPPIVSFGFMAIGCLAAGSVFYLVVEKPLVRLLNPKTAKPGDRDAPAPLDRGAAATSEPG